MLDGDKLIQELERAKKLERMYREWYSITFAYFYYYKTKNREDCLCNNVVGLEALNKLRDCGIYQSSKN